VSYLSLWSYLPARIHRLAESIPRNRFLGSLNVYKFGLRKREKRLTGYMYFERKEEKKWQKGAVIANTV
jgi:hypothetical protein